MANITRSEAERTQRLLGQMHDAVQNLSNIVNGDNPAERVNSLNVRISLDSSVYITQRLTRSVYIRAPRFDQVTD